MFFILICTSIKSTALFTAYMSDVCVLWMLWLTVDACNLYKGDCRMYSSCYSVCVACVCIMLVSLAFLYLTKHAHVYAVFAKINVG